jgi:hypothetical protein
MPNWKKLIVSGSDASLNSLNVTNNVTAQSFTGSFSGSFTAPGATTQIVYNNGGVLAASSSFVFSGSNVGIGTTTPAAKLDVNGNAFIGTTLSVGTTYSGFTANIAGTTYIIGASVWVNDGYGYVNASSNTGMFPDSSHNITFKSNNSTKVYINAAGNVGIGTTSPGAKLQISGGTLDGSALTELGISSGLTTGRLGTFDASSLASISTRGDASSVELAAGSSATYYTGISATANNATLFTGTLRFFTSGSEKVRITPAGNLVINSVTTPYVDDKLYIASGNIIVDNNRGYLQYTTGGARATLLALNSSNNLSVGQNNANNASLLLYGGTGNVTVNAAAIEVARFTTAGNVGIGTTSPSTILHLSSTSPELSFTATSLNRTSTVGMGDGANFYIKNTSAGNMYISDYNSVYIAYGASSQNVGIGTTSPSAKLQVKGDGGTTGITFQTTDSSNNQNLYVLDGGRAGINYYPFMIAHSSSVAPTGDPYLQVATSALYVSQSGNVGIGTASPTAKLEVNGNVKATSFTGSFSGSVSAPGSTTQIVYNDNGVLAASSGLVYSGSNVGIGISSPTEKLHIVSSAAGNQFARITATDSNASAAWVAQNDSGDNIVYRVFSSGVSGTQMGAALGRSASLLANLGGSGVFLLGTFSNTNFILGTNNTERMRITTAGNVGIGTTSPGGKLQIADGSSGTTNDSSTTLYVENDGSSNSFYVLQTATFGGGKSFSVTNAGNVGIGTTSPSQKLEVQGQAQIGNDSITSAGLFIARKNTNQAKSHYFLSAQESPTYQWIEGGYFTSELAGVSVANNSGKPYYESYSPAGQYKSFGFINQTTSGSSFTSTAATASMVLYQGGNIALAPTQGNVGVGTYSPSARLHISGSTDATQRIIVDGSGNNSSLHLNYNGSNVGFINSYQNSELNIGTSVSAFVNFYTNNTERMRIAAGGNVGIGTSSPGYKLEVVGAVSASTYYGDGSNLTGIGSGSVAAAGSDGQLQYNNSGLFGGASRLYYNDSTNRVGIGTSSPGYDLDVSGSARVQDRLRVGAVNTGNGVIHQSSDATINPSGATIVWSVPGSSGAVAFIEYYIINTVTSTSQRGGNIVVTWNSAGTPQITHTETTTPDIGTTALVTFTTAITLGGDPQLVATNTSINPFYIVLNYRYF